MRTTAPSCLSTSSRQCRNYHLGQRNLSRRRNPETGKRDVTGKVFDEFPPRYSPDGQQAHRTSEIPAEAHSPEVWRLARAREANSSSPRLICLLLTRERCDRCPAGPEPGTAVILTDQEERSLFDQGSPQARPGQPCRERFPGQRCGSFGGCD